MQLEERNNADENGSEQKRQLRASVGLQIRARRSAELLLLVEVADETASLTIEKQNFVFYGFILVFILPAYDRYSLPFHSHKSSLCSFSHSFA